MAALTCLASTSATKRNVWQHWHQDDAVGRGGVVVDGNAGLVQFFVVPEDGVAEGVVAHGGDEEGVGVETGLVSML